MNKLYRIIKILLIVPLFFLGIAFLRIQSAQAFIFGSENKVAQWIKDSGVIRLRTETNDVRIGSGNGAFFVDTSVGNIGINNATPTYKLTVSGDGQFSSYVDANYYVATSTTATSTLPNLSLTNLLFGSDYLTDITGGGLAINGSSLEVQDVICTDCLNATEIEDLYVLNSGDTMTGNLVMDTNNITMTGSLADTTNRVTKGWFTDIESTNMLTIGGASLSDTFVDVAGDTMTGDLILANSVTSLNSGDYALQLNSAVTDGSSAIGFQFDTTNTLTGADHRIFSFSNNGTEKLYYGEDSSVEGLVNVGHGAFGELATLSATSLLNIAGSVTPSGVTYLAPEGAMNVEPTMVFSNTLAGMAAFNLKATVTGGGVLPFPSGQVAQVINSGTGAWGANIDTNSPAIHKAKFSSTAGASDLGNFVSVYQSMTPVFSDNAAVRSDGSYIAFEAQSVDGTVALKNWTNSYGFLVRSQDADTEGAGFIYQNSGAKGHYGMILEGDGVTSSLALGIGRDATIYYDGTDLIINPQAVGTGKASVQGSLQATDYYSGDGTQGITNSASYWFCTASDCSTTCQVTIKDGLITGCP